MKRKMLVAMIVCAMVGLSAAWGAEVKILLPLDRKAYQTNEQIDVSVIRSAPDALAAGSLVLTLMGDDGSKLAFTFPLPAVAKAANDARATENLHLNGRLLRPGHYKMDVAADGASASAEIDVCSHVRKSTFKTVPWNCSAREAEIEAMGEDSLGYNVLFLNGMGDYSIRGGVDWIQNDIQGGGAQMDLRGECDWSDPYVIRGGAARVSRAVFQQRRQPNVLGIHLYDELMLANAKDPDDPDSKGRTPHAVPSQLRAWKAAFGEDLLSHTGSSTRTSRTTPHAGRSGLAGNSRSSRPTTSSTDSRPSMCGRTS